MAVQVANTYHSAADVASLCEGVRRSGAGFTAICPAHDDRLASLSIHDGKKGTVLHCHAGCHSQDILTELGLTMPQMYEDYSPNGFHDSEVNLMLRDLVKANRQGEPSVANRTLGDVMWQAFKSGEDAWFRTYQEHADLMDLDYEDAEKMWGIVADTVVFTYLKPWLDGLTSFNWHDIRREAMGSLRTAHRERIRYEAGY